MRNSIRTRLSITFIGLATLPLLLVGIILAWQSFTIEQQQALTLQHEVARRVATEVTAFFEGLENELRFVSRAQTLPNLDRDAQQNLLKLLMVRDIFEDVVLVDDQGQERIHLARLGLVLDPHRHKAETDEFVIPQTSGQVYYSPVRFEEITGEPLITIAVPLLDVRTGLVEGVLISEIRMKKIWDLIADVRVSPGQSIYIVDAQDNVVAHRNPSVVLRETRFRIPERNGIHFGLTGERTILVSETLYFGEQAFYVVAEQAVSGALALAIRTVVVIAILIVAALLIAGGLGFLSVRQIVRPIQAMATTAEAISAGDLSQQVDVVSQDELGVFAMAFNSMTAQLRKIITDLEEQVVERKRAEESLRETNETLHALFDFSPLSIFMIDLESRVLLWNKASERMFGWTSQEALGEFLPIISEEKQEEHYAIRDRVTSGESLTHLKLQRQRKDGSTFFLEASIAPLRDANSKVYAQMCIAADITQRKLAEDEICRLNADLEDRVKARTAKLELANRELKDFAYVVSHDLKAPLRAISRLAFWLREDYAQAFDEEGREMVDLLIGRVKRMDNLIDGILEYSRIGRSESPYVPVDLNRLIADVLDSLAPPEHIRITVTGELPTLTFEKTRLSQIFQNLIGNAVKFMDKPHGEIEICCIEEHGCWRFSVSDNGMGIDSKYHDRIFQIFQTLRPRDEFESTGIGLAMVKKIIELYGGRIWLKSKVGEGSHFFFTLPIHQRIKIGF